MSILYLTVFLSMALAVLFMVFFVVHFKDGSGSPEQDALLPFSDESKPSSKKSTTAAEVPARPLSK